MTAASNGERLRVPDIDDDIVRRRIVALVGEPSEPPEGLATVRHARVPETHRREMREARVLVAAAVHDGQATILVEPLEADHRWMHAESIGELDDLALANSQRRPGAIVRGIAVRYDGVQPVVAARELEDDEDSLGMLFGARALQRLRRQRRRRAAQKERQPRTDADAVQTARQELTPRARTEAHTDPSSHQRPLCPLCPSCLFSAAI